jgi:hypothetical protein
MKKNLVRIGFVAVIASLGFAFQVKSDGSKLKVEGPVYQCPDVYDPVCTPDGRKFSNSCYATLAGYTEYTKCGEVM